MQPRGQATPIAHSRRINFWIIFVLAGVTLALYARTATFGFVDYDDGHYVSDNPHLRLGFTFKGIAWTFTTLYFCNWHPLTWLVYLADTSIFGLRAGPIHVINSCLHAANAALLFHLLWRMTGRLWPAAVTAALFAWHPLRVESVAWISETKDVLAGFCFLLTLLAYLRYAERPSILRYVIVAVAYAMALMSKPSVVTLPCVLLLLDYWPLRRAGSMRRWGTLVLEKIPFILLTIGASILFYRAQLASGSLVIGKIIPLSNRAANAVVSVGQYLLKTIWPAHLAICYPHPFLSGTPIPMWQIATSIAVVLVITILAFHIRQTMPFVIVGWLWFLGMLVPMLGLIQAGEQSMADRYSYLPSIGLLIAIVFLAADLLPSRFFWAVSICLALPLSAVTELQISYWQNSTALFTRSNQITQRNFEARAMLAYELLRADRVEQALPLAQSAVAICPLVPVTHHMLGLVLQAAGRQHEAVTALSTAFKLDPYDPTISNDMGALLLEMNLNSNAVAWFQRAIHLEPAFVAPRQNLAMSLAADGKMDQAIAQWREALQIDPKFGPAHGWLATALERQGDRAGAVEHFSAAINNGERRPEWLTELAWLLATDPHSTDDQVKQAIACAQEACDKTQNSDARALDALGAALARSGQFDAAAVAATKGIDAANAANQPALAKAIETRMMSYRAGQPFVAAH
jgi:protein O-mannosyl-transferase